MIRENLQDLSQFIDTHNPFKVDLNKKFDPKNMPFVKEPGFKVDLIESEFDSVLEETYADRERESDDWNLYSGLDNAQWDAEIAAELKKQGRNPFQSNFIRQKVDSLVGGLVKNGFDVAFRPTDGGVTDLTKIIKEIYFSDKEMMDWEASYLELVRNGCVHLGVEELYVSFRNSPLGNIGFRTILPGHILLDPHWTSNNTRDLKRAWKTAYMTPKQLEDNYDAHTDLIKARVYQQSITESNYDQGDKSRGVLRFEQNERYEDLYRVIEYHHMEVERKKVDIIAATGQVLPEMDEENLREWAMVNEIDIENPDTLVQRKIKTDVSYITTICPWLSREKPLEDRKHLLQLGRLPFFPWAFSRINGKFSGIPELLKSLQRTYNKRESMIDHMVSTSANGAVAIDPAIVGGDAQERARIEENWNKAGFKFWTEEGALASGRNHFQEIPRPAHDFGIVQDMNRYVDTMDRISRQPAASDARSEGSEESGILFARKQLQAEVNLNAVSKSLGQHWNDKGEAYLLGAKQLYGGVYREFVIPKKDDTGQEAFESVEINVPYITPEGEVVYNDISMLPRMKVIVSESPEGMTMRMTNRAIYTELLRVLGEQNPIQRSLAIKNVMKTLDQSTGERKEFEEAANIEAMVAKETMLAQLEQIQMQRMQMQAMAGQAAGGGQPQPQGGGGEAPQAPGNPAQQMSGNTQQMVQQLT